MLKKESVCLGEVLEKYLNTVSCEKKGWQQELYRVNVIKKYQLSHKLMREITSVDISNYRDERLSTFNGVTKKAISPNTVRLELALLSSVFKVAQVEWGLCNSNPVAAVRKPKIGKGRDRRLLKKEEVMLSDFFKSNDYVFYVIFHLALETAMRQGEILGLLWENINLSIGVAHLPETKNGTWRDVPLSKKARDILLSLGPKANGKVFTKTSNSFKSKWRKSLGYLGIVNLTFHDLRHEAISRLFELGTLNVIEVASISGHKSLAMLKRYTHLKAYQLVKKIDAKTKRVNRIASYFVPYPAVIEKKSRGYSIKFIDFDELVIYGVSEYVAIANASSELLKILAVSAQKGLSIPAPGEYGSGREDVIMINPLN